jgi:hypothetical protein
MNFPEAVGFFTYDGEGSRISGLSDLGLPLSSNWKQIVVGWT